MRSAALVGIAGGGSGSAVYPALAVAQELRAEGMEAVFLGEATGPEGRVVPQHGFRLRPVSGVTLQRPAKTLGNAYRACVRFPLCVLESLVALAALAPNAVVAVGGPVALAPAVAAVLLAIPVLVYEMNAQAGQVNSRLSTVARRTLLAYDSARQGMRRQDRCVVVGPAVRSQVLRAVEDPAVRKATRGSLGVAARGGRLLVVLGGSSGCPYLNAAVHAALPQLTATPGLRILWQTGPRQFAAYAAGYAGDCPAVRVVPQLQDVGAALAAADLVLSRAGAGAVAELHAAGAPAVLVPSPKVSQEQQTANAKTLVDAGHAVLVHQEVVDEHGIAGQLLPLLAGDGKQLAAMRAGTGTGSGSGGTAAGGPHTDVVTAAGAVSRAIRELVTRRPL